jgi:2-alkenal reductase
MPKVNKNAMVFSLFIAFIALVSLACGLSAPQAITKTSPTQPAATVEVIQIEPTSSSTQIASILSEDQVLVDMYSRLNPSVVNITVLMNQNGILSPYAMGSGFVFDVQGHIATNAHVVEGADEIDITFSDGLIRVGTLVGEDLFSDLAVVKVELPKGVSPIPLGNMENLDVGETVVAIGNPFGFEGTLTRGVISALGRTIPTTTQYSIPQAIQTDAAINPGNSGGPLLNLNGEVVGINAQIETSGSSIANAGVGFAIPVSILQRVIPALIEKGNYEWPWLGVSGYTVHPALIKAMNLPVEQGAYVATITEGGPAADAGIKASTETVTQDGREVEIGGDVIIAINGQPVKTFDDLLIYLSVSTSPGQEVTLTILRDGQQQEIKVKLGIRPTT